MTRCGFCWCAVLRRAFPCFMVEFGQDFRCRENTAEDAVGKQAQANKRYQAQANKRTLIFFYFAHSTTSLFFLNDLDIFPHGGAVGVLDLSPFLATVNFSGEVHEGRLVGWLVGWGEGGFVSATLLVLLFQEKQGYSSCNQRCFTPRPAARFLV